MNHIEVQIMQQGYRLACPEGQQETLLQAVERVDAAMTRIRDAGKVRARERIAVLAALNLAFELADHQARSAQQPQLQPQQHPAGPVAHPGSEASPPQAAGSVESLQDDAPQAAASAVAPPALEAAAEAAAPPDGAIGAAGDDALEALLRRLDQALGQEGRPA